MCATVIRLFFCRPHKQSGTRDYWSDFKGSPITPAMAEILEDILRKCTLQGVDVSGKRLGSGAYGTVFEAHYCGIPFAAKEVHPLLLEYSGRVDGAKIKENFVKECYNLSECHHPNIVQFIGFSIRPRE